MTTHKTANERKKRASAASRPKAAHTKPPAGDLNEQDRQVLAKVAYGHELTATDKRRLRKIGAGFGIDPSVKGWEEGKPVPTVGFPGVTETHYLSKNGVVITELHGLPPLDLTGREGEFTEVKMISRAEYEASLARAKMLRDFVPSPTGDGPRKPKKGAHSLGATAIKHSGRALLKKMPAATPIKRIRLETKAETIPLEGTPPHRARIETPHISGEIDVGILNEALATVLKSWGVPESDFEATAAELERVARARANAARRPKWDERGKYAELKDLSAPQFLKRVYADVITPNGSIEKQVVRDIDPRLMASVEVYLSNRKSRQKDLGDADGLQLIAGPTSPLKRAGLG